MRKVNWALVMIAVLVNAEVCAGDTHYCITAENGTKTVTQCQNGTVSIVDDYEGKVVVCSAAAGDSPRCQVLPFKDAK